MKNFDDWNRVKKAIDSSTDTISKFPQEGEVWMCRLGKNIGFEQNGVGRDFSRPVLIVKKFNNHMFWVIPLSTKQKEFNFYFNYTDPNMQKVSAIIAQMKLCSIKRIDRKMYEMEKRIFQQIKTKLTSLF